MPFNTVIGLIFIFAMFGSFMVALSGAAIWVGLGERAERKAIKAQPVMVAAQREYSKAA